MNESPADEVFVYTISGDFNHDQLEAYQRLQRRMDHAARGFPGYLQQECSVNTDPQDGRLHATVRLHFQSLAACLSWLDSAERRALLREADEQFGYRYRTTLEGQSFNQWLSARHPPKAPVWKVNLLVWLALYPSVMGLLWVGESTLGRLPLPMNMLISNGLTVAFTGWVLVPWLSRVYRPWLTTRSRRLNVLFGLSVPVALLFALWFFSHVPGAPWSQMS